MIPMLTDRDLELKGDGSRTTRWRKVQRGEYPPPVNIGTEAAPQNRWFDDEMNAYYNALRAGKTLREAVEAARVVREEAAARWREMMEARRRREGTTA